MKVSDVDKLIDRYWLSEQSERNVPVGGHNLFGQFEHRLDAHSAKMLYSFIREYKPKFTLEIGTSRGGSTCAVALALRRNQNGARMVASELLDDLRDQMKTNVRAVTPFRFKAVGDITKNLKHIPKELDCLLVDTDHDLETTEWIVKHIFPRVRKGGLVFFHDWAVEDIDGVWVGKGDNGRGAWEETQYLMDLYSEGVLPLKKIFWTYNNPGREESSFWEKV